MEIHRDFVHGHDLLAKVMRNEKTLIYYGLFLGHEWSDDMGNSYGVYYYYYISVEFRLIWFICFCRHGLVRGSVGLS